MTTKFLRAKMMRVPYKHTVQQYLADLHLEDLSEHTIGGYAKVLRGFERFMCAGQPGAELLLSTITPERAKAYIAHRQGLDQAWADHPHKPTEERRLAPATIHQDVRSLKTFGVWLSENGYTNPFEALKLPKLPRHLIEILEEDEIKTLAAVHNPNTWFGARWQTILGLALDTGVRLNEVVTLELKDLNLAQCRLKVCGKGDKERILPFGSQVHKLLSRYLNLFRQGDAPNVFVNQDGTLMTASGLQDIVRKVRAKAGIERFHFHLLRHTFATNFLLVGGNAFELQALLGHESLTMTEHYVHLAQQLARTTQSVGQRRPTPLDASGLDFTRARSGFKGKGFKPGSAKSLGDALSTAHAG